MVDTPETPDTDSFGEQEWSLLAEQIQQDFTQRKAARKDLEQRWDEVDRQVAMTPRPRKKGDPTPKWHPNYELPLQATALEMLESDARRLMFPTDRSEFSPKVSLDEEDLQNLDFDRLIAADQSVTTTIKKAIDDKGPQVFVNALVKNVLHWNHDQYDYRGQWDKINAEAFKYSVSCPRIRSVNWDASTNEWRGLKTGDKIPALVVPSIRDTYLDDSPGKLLEEGFIVEPSPIRSFLINIHDLALAANRGKNDPTREDGGWMPKNLENLEPLAKPRDHVRLIEMEGDILVPKRTQGTHYIPNVIVTIATGNNGNRVIRFREREFAFRSYLINQYHRENLNSAYSGSPLLKGQPVQDAASRALNKLIAAGELAVAPPVRWDPADHWLAAKGGPEIYPNAQWPALTAPDPIEITSAQGINALGDVYLQLLRQYAEVTGITGPRLGQQTKSHQTAFAVDSEISRGVVRTVDYVRQVMFGPMMSFLHMEYEMTRKMFKKRLIYFPEFGGYVEVDRKMLPKHVVFDMEGSGGPLEEREREARFFGAIQGFLQLEGLAQQGGGTPGDIDRIRRSILRRGGLEDAEIDTFFAEASATIPQGVAQRSPVSSVGGDTPAGEAATLLQATTQ